jgi:hypothetical protein
MSIPRFTIVALIAVALAAVAIAAWPASETDKARDDGEQLGEAVNQLYYAESSAEVDDALAEIDEAATATRDHAGDAVAEQVAAQEDALARAADGFAGSVTADAEFDQDLYQAELELALDDLTSQASDFRAQGPEVNEAYWEGFDEGLSSE